jgi:parafibromin
VQWANDPPNTKISDWNVAPLKVRTCVFLLNRTHISFQIEPNRRHVDKSVVAEFWKILDAWMLANKPWLMR